MGLSEFEVKMLDHLHKYYTDKEYNKNAPGAVPKSDPIPYVDRWFKLYRNRLLSSSVERRLDKATAEGSIPSGATISE